MEEINFKDIAKKFNKLQEENRRLQHTKERYITYAKELHESGLKLINLSKEIDPLVGGSAHKNKSVIPYKDIAISIMQALENGEQVSRKAIIIKYELQEYQGVLLFATLKRMNPKVSKRWGDKKEGLLWFLDE